MKHYLSFSVLIMMLASACTAAVPAKVRLGVDVLLSGRLELIKGKRVGLITNPTGLTSSHEATIDALAKAPGVKLVALYGPEHGVRGAADAGEAVDNYVDEHTGVKVFSLYGKTHKPTAEMLQGVDVLLYDIQDIGSRAYTYIYTMAYCMEAAKEHNIPFIVLDRPNPLGGELLEGPVLDPKFKSGIGLYPIPYVYGMTVGELARLFNQEFGIGCNLTVVPLAGWERSMRFEETGIMWVPTSPHIPYPMTTWYCATIGCLGELQQVNEGVGMPAPFEFIGAEWIKADKLAAELNGRALPGVFFRALHYRPFYGNFKGLDLQGVQIHILDRKVFRPMFTQIHLLSALHLLYPERNIYDTQRVGMFNKAMGTDRVQMQVRAGESVANIIASWEPAMRQFEKLRQKYLLYQ